MIRILLISGLILMGCQQRPTQADPIDHCISLLRQIRDPSVPFIIDDLQKLRSGKDPENAELALIALDGGSRYFENNDMSYEITFYKEIVHHNNKTYYNRGFLVTLHHVDIVTIKIPDFSSEAYK